MSGMERPKTYAERQLERAEAIQRLKQQLSGTGERPCSITSADIPDQIARPKPNKTFVVIGISIIVLLVIAHFISAFSNSKQEKRSSKPVSVEAVEAD